MRVNGKRSSLLTVLRNGKASTLDIIHGVKNTLPRILAGLPKALKVQPLFDQSLFVRAAIGGVLREGAIAAALTGLMILLFIGSWRSTIIVAISIPLSGVNYFFRLAIARMLSGVSPSKPAIKPAMTQMPRSCSS